MRRTDAAAMGPDRLVEGEASAAMMTGAATESPAVTTAAAAAAPSAGAPHTGAISAVHTDEGRLRKACVQQKRGREWRRGARSVV